jgi:Xaa-Pro aminopeptidase
MTASHYTHLELARFRAVQQLAYRCAVEVAGELTAGTTEKEAAARLGRRLADHGVRAFFHRPFAWFGDRTCFAGFRTPLDFFPSERRLEEGMPAILDVAPVVDGYPADIGYAFALGRNDVLERALDDLAAFRTLVLERVGAGDTLGEIYRAVEDLLADLGYRSCHRDYPFAVLAHRVYRLPRTPLSRVRLAGFGLPAGIGLLGQVALSRLPARIGELVPRLRQGTPFCNVGAGSDARPEPGLWAFEPHIARGDVGAKWEEMLVVDDEGARWLDDDLPHVRRWRRPRVATGT